MRQNMAILGILVAFAALGFSALAIGGRADQAARTSAEENAQQGPAILDSAQLAPAKDVAEEIARLKQAIDHNPIEENPAFATFEIDQKEPLHAASSGRPASMTMDQGLAKQTRQEQEEPAPAPPTESARPVEALRQAAVFLDQAAQLLETAEQYRWADDLRQTGGDLRDEARRIHAENR